MRDRGSYVTSIDESMISDVALMHKEANVVVEMKSALYYPNECHLILVRYESG
jgi:hypothetical protein